MSHSSGRNNSERKTKKVFLCVGSVNNALRLMNIKKPEFCGKSKTTKKGKVLLVLITIFYDIYNKRKNIRQKKEKQSIKKNFESISKFEGRL